MNKIKELLNKYDLRAKSLKISDELKIVTTDNGKYVIKKKKNDDARDLFKHLNSKNFHNYLDYINDENDDFMIFPYIETINNDNFIAASDMIVLVANLHAKTSFYKTYPLYEVKTFYEEKLKQINELEIYYNNLRLMIEEEEFPSPSNYNLLRNISWIFHSLDSSKYFLNKWYEIEQNKKNKRVCLIHGNLDLSHFVGTEEKFFISWDNAKNDSPVFDLIKFYKNNYKDVSFYTLFTLYEERYPLLPEERYLLFCLMFIPEKLSFDKEEIINTTNVYYAIKYLITSSEIISDYHSANTNSQND